MSVAEDMALLSPRKSAGVAPLRVAGSVRRTSTIDVSWPEGQWGNALFTARARDLLSPADGGEPLVCAEDSFVATIDQMRTILAIEISPERPAQDKLVGLRGGGHLRHALEEIMPEERVEGTPLHLILDDISGASLVAGWAWSQWNGGWRTNPDGSFDQAQFDRAMAQRVGICTGFASDSSVHLLGANRKPSTGAPTPDLRNPADPIGWHDYAVQSGVGMRRARRIDVMVEGGEIRIESAFQDSATSPKGGRAALHEYTLSARADLKTLRLTRITAEPRVLPFPECPGATATLPSLEGESLSDLRSLVLERLRGTAGCTHLNDALRALAEVPQLLARLTP